MKNYFLILLIIFFTGCGIEQKFDSAFLAMGNIPINIVIYSVDDNHIEETFSEIRDTVRILDSLLNKYNENSPIYAFNNHDIPIPVNIHIDSLINYSNTVKYATNGLFDITIETILTYYKRAEKRNIISMDSIQYFTTLMMNNEIYFDSNGLLRKTHNDMMIDFGGIAKGYIGELIKRIIRKNGFDKAIIDLGGDIVLLNDNRNKSFNIGIRSADGQGIYRTIHIMSGGVMTSGDYFRFYEIDGDMYCHIINPKKGIPNEKYHSITVMYENGALCDAFATAFMMMDKKDIQRICDSLSIEVEFQK